MDLLDNGGLREVQQVVMPLQIFLPIFEPFAPKRRLVQLPLLNHGSHGPVENDECVVGVSASNDPRHPTCRPAIKSAVMVKKVRPS